MFLHSNKVRDEELYSWEFCASHCLILTVDFNFWVLPMTDFSIEMGFSRFLLWTVLSQNLYGRGLNWIEGRYDLSSIHSFVLE